MRLARACSRVPLVIILGSHLFATYIFFKVFISFILFAFTFLFAFFFVFPSPTLRDSWGVGAAAAIRLFIFRLNLARLHIGEQESSST